MNLIDQLQQHGWIKFDNRLKSCDHSFYKTFQGHEECRCNQNKRKQVEVYIWDNWVKNLHNPMISVEINCVGELPDGSWVHHEFYGLKPDIDYINQKTEEILQIWDYSVKNNLTLKK